jgi:hypothetical protein
VDSRTTKPHRPGEKIEIQPGMTANVEIQTGKNTVFRYLAKPSANPATLDKYLSLQSENPAS